MFKSCPPKYVEAKDLPTKSVIVYANCAEVKRVIKLELDQGSNNVIVQNVSSVIEHQSIKVDSRGTSVIQDVQYIEQCVGIVENQDNRVSKLEEEKMQLESTKADAEDAIHVIMKRLEILDGVACQIGQNVDIPHGQKPVSVNQAFLLCQDVVENLTTFLDYYGKTASNLKQELRNQEKKVQELKEKIDCVERNIDQLRCRFEYDNHKRNISIIIDVAEAGLTELNLSYQVYCASWKPTYDIRASTSGIDSSAANKVKILYYGLIEQKSDEDWLNTELVLSTATPCVAGTVPTLPILNAVFQRRAQTSVRQRNVSSARRKPNSNGSEEDMGFGSFDYNEFTDAAALQKLTIAYTASDHEHSLEQNYEHIPCTCFPIEAPATILCDGLSHKVQIASLEFDPVLTHETAPSKAASAFLTAIIVNNLTLPLLPGSASVYLNNSFISTKSLKSTLPGEEFKCSLGIDPSIKVEYKPCVRSNELVGFMTKSSLCTHEQVVTLRNTKILQSAVLTVREPIPKAMDEKIKICVLSPDLRPGRMDARINKDQHLEWVVTLAPGEQRDLHIKYTVEYPIHEAVTYYNQNKTF